MVHPVTNQSVQTTAVYSRDFTHCGDHTECRTLSGIIWSCLTTIFACTWVALHLNIPAPDEKWCTTMARRTGIMVLALIAPELVVAWAMRQWLVARRIAKEHQEYEWTQVHGLFAVMGGFMLYVGDQPRRTLAPTELGPHLEKGEIDVTEEDIKDKSKGDMLSKCIVITQTGWFIIQCLARAVQRLPVTELEIVTLAFASLNFVTYWLWWNKPLDVQRPVPVCKTTTLRQDDIVNTRVADERKDHNVFKQTHECLMAIPNAMQHAINRALEYAKRVGWCKAVILALVNGIAIPVAVPIMMLADLGFGTMGTDEIGPVQKRVSTFYSGKLTDRERAHARLVAAAFAAVFGAVHCIAWSFPFPTRTEQILWRVSCLVIMCVPLLALLSDWFGIALWADSRLVDRIQSRWGQDVFGTVSGMVYISAAFLYVLARVTLLVQAFISLRLVPPGVYQTVQWTTHLPHI